MVSATNTVLASGMLLLGSSMSALPQEAATKTLYFEDEICLNVDLTAPEIVDVRTARRFSLNAPRGLFLEATSFDLELPSTGSIVSLSFASPEYDRAGTTAQYFASCSFVDEAGGFQRQIDTEGCRIIGDARVYHSQPGLKENVRVRCRELLATSCRMRTIGTVGPLNVPVSVFIADSPLSSWMPIANEVRSLVADHVTHLLDC